MKAKQLDEKITDLLGSQLTNTLSVIINDEVSGKDRLLASFTGKNDWFDVPVSLLRELDKVGYVLVEERLYPVVDISIKAENQLFYEDLIKRKFSGGVLVDEGESAPQRSHFLAEVSTAASELSGIQWVSRFPGRRDIDALASPFRENVKKFHAALVDAHANISIGATFRPIQRAYLMRSCYQISRGLRKPEDIEPFDGVTINWVHDTLAASIAAATAMVNGYNIVHLPALNTRHSLGLAIDMTVSWNGILAIKQANGIVKSIASSPKNNTNVELAAVARTYNVIKNPTDPPHWSDNGH